MRGRLVLRYKRFLADVETARGEVVTMHCPNTGAMSGCSAPGSEVWYSTNGNPRRKYPETLELVRSETGSLVGVNTMRANHLVGEALDAGLIAELAGYEDRRREVVDPESGRRFDFVLLRGKSRCFVEVKSVTLVRNAGWAVFPDAPSERARAHIELLHARQQDGDMSALVFCVQRADAYGVAPADDVDERYAASLRRASAGGVAMFALGAALTPGEVRLVRRLPVVL